ncbi:MAG: hypothetical protein ACE5K3_03475 [bacterium]
MRKKKDVLSEERTVRCRKAAHEFHVFPGPQGAAGNEKTSRSNSKLIYSDGGEESRDILGLCLVEKCELRDERVDPRVSKWLIQDSVDAL